MDNIDNYIYLDICEILYTDGYMQTKFSTFTSYCKILKYSIDGKDIRHKECQLILKINDYLSLVYNMGSYEPLKYLETFLAADVEIQNQFLSCVKSSKKTRFNQ